jgi:hypothetical protein
VTERVNPIVGLAVHEDGERMVCLVCAKEHAQASGYPRLYWMVNSLEQVSGDDLCGCGRRMASAEAHDAAEEIADYMS